MSPASPDRRGKHAFPPQERLRSGSQFRRVLKDGKKISQGSITIYYLPVPGDTKKLGLTVGKSAGGAVARNRIKRLFREAYRHRRQSLPADLWLVIRYRPGEQDKRALSEPGKVKYSRKDLKRLRRITDSLLSGLAERSAAGEGNPGKNEMPGSMVRWGGWSYQVFVLPVRLWQSVFSNIFPSSCRFYPSCSDYALTALAKYGLIKGTGKSLWRILRCNPFNPGGYDPP
jgi:putative membrane protein insertion efficiency factor/ribonuclease P protein component